MGTDKRDRKKANRAARAAAEEAADSRRRRIAFIRNAVILAVALLVVAAVLSSCSSSGSDGDGASPSLDPTATTTADPATCPPEAGSKTPTLTFSAPPPTCIDPAKTYKAIVDTTLGTFTVQLDTKRTPGTANNFVVLSRHGYYDNTAFFRTEAATGIVQGGSPHTQGPSDPGPGYTIDDEGIPFTTDDYAAGALAMARTSAPNSASGQFFLLANDGGRYLGDTEQLGNSAGTYVVFGHVIQGLSVVQKIAALDNGSGAPTTAPTITNVTIVES